MGPESQSRPNLWAPIGPNSQPMRKRPSTMNTRRKVSHTKMPFPSGKRKMALTKMTKREPNQRPPKNREKKKTKVTTRNQKRPKAKSQSKTRTPKRRRKPAEPLLNPKTRPLLPRRARALRPKTRMPKTRMPKLKRKKPKKQLVKKIKKKNNLLSTHISLFCRNTNHHGIFSVQFSSHLYIQK